MNVVIFNNKKITNIDMDIVLRQSKRPKISIK